MKEIILTEFRNFGFELTENVDLDEELKNLGIDSLKLVAFVTYVCDVLLLDLTLFSDDELINLKTLNNLIDLLKKYKHEI